MRVPAAGQERAAHPARDAAGRWIVGLSACGLALVVACPSAETGPAADGPAQQVLLPILGPRLVLSGPPSERTRVPSPTLDATRETTATQGPPSSTPTAACARLAERLSVTTNSVGAAIRANDEYHPLPLAARDDGGVLVAWREASAARVRVGAFDEDGRLEGVPLSFDGEEVHALVAHADGGAMAVVADDPRIFSPRYCRGPNTPDKPLCASLDLWRFDGTGRTLWRTTATGSRNVDSDGALFVWWYQHTARLVWTGSEYGLYFRCATSSPRPGVPREIDIHAGDTFRFIDGSGGLLDGAWDWGCSHSWSVRLAFNGRYGAACHGDAYPNAFHVNVFDRLRQMGDVKLHEGLDPTRRALGGIVPTPDGFWLLHMAQEASAMELHLAFVDNAGRPTRDEVLPEAVGLETSYPYRPYLAEYGADAMLAGWHTRGALHLAVLDRASGALVDGPVEVAAHIDKWGEFVPLPNGDVGWAYGAGGTDRLDLVRVRVCAAGPDGP